MHIKISPFARCKAALAAVVLVVASAPACAGLFSFEGSTDSGTLLGQTFSGSFSFADPTAGFSGPVDLDAFGLDVFGRSYTLDDADTTPVALFDSGAFLGVDYISSAALPVVQLTAGFFDASESFFAYQSAEPGFDDGFGSIVFTPVANPVPAPATLVLALSGLLLLGGTLARRA